MNGLRKIILCALPLSALYSHLSWAVDVSCQNLALGNVTCDFSGSGDDLTDQLNKVINKYNGNLTLNIKQGQYLLKPLTIKKMSQINLHLDANVTLIAPERGDTSWSDNEGLINLVNVSNFLLSGTDPNTSIIDGQGGSWWNKASSNSRPFLVHINHINGLEMSNIQLHNSPRFHVMIRGGQNINIHDMTINSPENSPNTDGINVGSINQMKINNVNIHNGDDGIAINAVNEPSTNIQISNVDLWYGHGISIGSGVKQVVSNIEVTNVHFHSSENGLRIKTACDKKDCSDTKKGIVSYVHYSDIHMDNVHRPIFYDLSYSDNGRTSYVAIQNISYQNITAENSRGPAQLFCGKYNKCNPITFDSVYVDTGLQCQGVNGGKVGKTVNCLQ